MIIEKDFYQSLIKSVKFGTPSPGDIAQALGGKVAQILKERPEELEPELRKYFAAVNRYHRKYQKDPEPLVSASVKALFKEAKRKHVDPQAVNVRLILSFLGFEGEAPAFEPSRSRGKRQEILRAALEIFSEKGFYQATMDEIASRGKLGKGTIYRYFATKEDLLQELVEEKFVSLRNEIYQTFEMKEDFVEMIKSIIRIYLEFFERDVNLYRIFIQEQPEAVAEFKSRYLFEILTYLPIIKEKMTEYMEKGVIKKLDFYSLFFGMMGYLNGILEKWFQSGCSYRMTRELPDIYEVLLHGILNHTPRPEISATES